MSKAKKTTADAVGAAEFKARCLELVDRVRESRAEYVVTRHGEPVAKLGPVDVPQRKASLLGSMRGSVLRYERPFDPIAGTWHFDQPHVIDDGVE